MAQKKRPIAFSSAKKINIVHNRSVFFAPFLSSHAQENPLLSFSTIFVGT
jgi:hypothetical protein